MTATSENQVSEFPCCVCMGFCLEDSNCILCDVCKNWFHRECVNLSHKKFSELSNDGNAKFTCTICIHNKHCEICDCGPTESEKFIYCVTCLNHYCDGCIPILSDQIDIYRNTDKPYYCPTCSEVYPCKICSEHCFYDSVRPPFINCSNCKSRVHLQCSKLTKKQFRKYRASEKPMYYCALCITKNVPFSNISNATLKKVVHTSGSNIEHVPPVTISNCTLCTVCNTDCKDCVVCPDNFRVCEDCTTQCSYVGVTELNTLFSNRDPNDLAIVHMNFRSLKKNLKEFDNLILQHLASKPDVICVSETKLASTSDIKCIALPGYTFYHNASTTKAGGTGVYLSNLCQFTVRNDLDFNLDGESEATFIEIVSYGKQSKNVILASVYRHPHDNHLEFLSAFGGKIESIQKKYHVIVLGDLNINTDDDNIVIDCQNYKNTLLSLGMRNTINLPTRVTESTETIIDHCITNVNPAVLHSGIVSVEITDHYPTFVITKLAIKKTKLYDKYRRKFSLTKKDEFINTLENLLLEDPILENGSSPHDRYKKLVSHIQCASNIVFPLVRLSCKLRKSLRKPWMTSGIRRSMDRRDLLLQKWLKTKASNDKKAYNICRNRINRIVRAAERNHNAHEIESSQADVRKLWKCINKISNRKSNSGSTLPDELKIDGKVLTNPLEIATSLNKHFVEKGPNLAKKLPNLNKDVLQYMGPRNATDMSFETILESQVLTIIDANKKVSTGSDNIPVILLQWASHLIAKLLANIFNGLVELGVYPDDLKIAKVTPLHKNGDKSDVDNFRPISVLTQINKVFEKLIHVRLMDFINQHKILKNYQFGFRKGHNTAHGINHLNEQILKNLEKKKVCAMLFIDLKSAFDTVDPTILIKKLDHYGIRGNVLSLLASYLSGRKQYIKSGDIESSLLPLLCGVPQGSVLGPLLFILYINDISNNSSFERSLYADDAAMLLADTKLKLLKRSVNRELSHLHEWLIVNKLTLNLSKTKYMLVANINKITYKDRKKFKLTIGKYTLHEVEKIKYLGVILDNNLNWIPHIDYLVTKLSQVAGVLFKVRNHLSLKSRIMIYNGLAGSYLNYGIVAWGAASISRLQTVQDRLVRYMTFLPPSANTDQSFATLKILNIKQHYFHEISKFVHSVHNNISPVIFNDYFIPVTDYRSSRPSRTFLHNDYVLPKPRTEKGKHSSIFAGVKLWSKIPLNFKRLSKKNFSYQLKQYIFDHGLELDILYT